MSHKMMLPCLEVQYRKEVKAASSGDRRVQFDDDMGHGVARTKRQYDNPVNSELLDLFQPPRTNVFSDLC